MFYCWQYAYLHLLLPYFAMLMHHQALPLIIPNRMLKIMKILLGINRKPPSSVAMTIARATAQLRAQNAKLIARKNAPQRKLRNAWRGVRKTRTLKYARSVAPCVECMENSDIRTYKNDSRNYVKNFDD